MIASSPNGVPVRRRTRHALAVLAALAVVAGAVPAPGQSPAPAAQSETLPGAPAGQAPPALEPPTPLLPFDPKARQPEGAGPAADAPLVEGIQINTLSDIEPDGLGLLDGAAGGLGRDLWAGSERQRVIGLLPLLPDRYHSAVLRDLARRLLLSRTEAPRRAPEAAPPAGAVAGGPAIEPDPTLLALRIDRLGAVGDTEDLARLLEIVPRRFDEEPITRARVETALLSGDLIDGCGEVRKGLPLYFSVPYWQKALIACQLVAGETDQAQLGLGLLKERGLPEDADFFLLAQALSGAEVALPARLAAQPLAFALLQARGQVPPPGTEQEAGLGVLVAMALSGKIGLEQRAAAAEMAAAAGALDPAQLGRIYDGFSFAVAELDGAAAPDLATSRGRALAYQRALRAVSPEARARVLAEALDAAWASDGRFAAFAATLQPLVSRLPRVQQTLPQAGAAGRALYAAGRFEEAATWLAFVQKAAITQPAAAEAASALWPYWRLAGGQAAVVGGGVASWQATQSKDDPAALDRRSDLLLAALRALDAGLGPAQARGVPTPEQLAARSSPDLAGDLPGDLSAELADAAAAGRRGETVLLALAAMGGERLAAVEPATLGAVLAALREVGFEQEARALAIETALAARI